MSENVCMKPRAKVSVVATNVPLGVIFDHAFDINVGPWNLVSDAAWALPLVCAVGVLMLFATLHLARAIGHVHGLMAKHLLVRTD